VQCHLGSGPFYRPIRVIEGYFYVVKAYNSGAAWSLFEGKGFLLGILGGIVLYGIWHYRVHLRLINPYTQLALGLFAGGVLGNMIDRLHQGYVFDFIQIYLGSYPWPAFNIADSAIVVGAILYALGPWMQKASRKLE
jgi:signal peptidase II